MKSTCLVNVFTNVSVNSVSISPSVVDKMFGGGYSRGRVALIILIISTSGRCQDLNVFVSQNNKTADKRAKVSEPLMKIENFQGYSICFREPSELDRII